ESEVVENVQRGKSKSAEIVEKLHALDESQVRALEPVRDRVKTMKNYLSELDSKFKSANLSVSSYNVNAIKDMKTYDRVITPFFNTDTRTGYEDDMSNQLQSRIKSINSSEIIMEAEQKKLDDSFLISANNVAEIRKLSSNFFCSASIIISEEFMDLILLCNWFDISSS